MYRFLQHQAGVPEVEGEMGRLVGKEKPAKRASDTFLGKKGSVLPHLRPRKNHCYVSQTKLKFSVERRTRVSLLKGISIVNQWDQTRKFRKEEGMGKLTHAENQATKDVDRG
jgi:hypothetical protein